MSKTDPMTAEGRYGPLDNARNSQVPHGGDEERVKKEKRLVRSSNEKKFDVAISATT